ncbi:dipeptide/oligopeptide/nickel ABC transporter permease/ATP-binding protein [Streptomyces sp. NPDC057718]|uniref:dipeptide/oligopeptide/nickel ABC transporter permease/ATP-binding protein n=1 Tax=Streptomyces sp. NPDC057718 TaxID=3346225 RepID=UPI00368EB357
MNHQRTHTLRRMWTRLSRKPLGLLALAWLLLVTLTSVAAPLLATHGPDDHDLDHVLSGPTAGHWLGTGVLGRDVLSRILHGGQVTLTGALISCLLYVAVGLPLGMVAGYVGGLVERLVLRLADLVQAVPAVIVLLVVVAVYPDNESAAMVALGLLGAPGLARVVRSHTRELREELFVRAAQVNGLRPTTILRRHILPRVTGTVIVQTSLFAAGAVLLETGLGFLGLGTDRASWGGLIAEASQNLGTQPWLLVPSGAVVILFVLALGLSGGALRDALAEGHGAATQERRTEHRAAPPATIAAPPRADALLSVRGLSVAFGTKDATTTVLTDVDLDIHAGDAIGIVGESGCGKSVTARAILGLLPKGGHITAGRVVFEGRDLTSLTPAELRAVRGSRIGWISQEPINSLDPSLTVGAQVAEAVRAHTDCSQAQARRRAVELLTAVRLPDPATIARRYPHQLSGGMAQRVGIAAALAGDPVLLIADEPTTALDVTVQAEIMDLFRDLQATGLAIMLVTHDWGALADLCDNAVVMYAGQVVERASVADMMITPRHPYSAGLLAANPHSAVPGQLLPAIEGTVPHPADWPKGCRFQSRCALATPRCAEAPIPLISLGPSGHTRCLNHTQLRPGALSADQSTPLTSGPQKAVHP